MSAFDSLRTTLTERQQAHLYRTRRTLGQAQQPETVIDGKPMLTFCSNDYLGLANDPRVVARFQAAASTYGVGSGASHLVNGHSEEHHQLEQELAAFTGRDRALLFSTGFMANLGTIQALVDKPDAVFEDRLNHASLLDGGLHSGAKFQRYLHNDVDNLTRRLEKDQSRRRLIVTDGVFSMDGDCAPIGELVNCAQQHNAWLMVDDAHGFGCIGSKGQGLVAEHFDQNQVQVLMGTLGKAFGTSGAFIAGSETLIETLIQFARPYIYTTAIPPAVAAATRTSLQLVQTEPERRTQLNKLIQRFRQEAKALGLTLMDSPTPIQPIVLGSETETLAWSQALEAEGLLVTAIRPPTVAKGSARLRITFSTSHTDAQLDRLLDSLDKICQQRGLPNGIQL
ncbi:8-amino-7-oxononanoate synthase [Oceanospirillum multiglobuliferum]|uniref:8-amino-7-oxononanoate synthase n=1 Tax=Oceanospirillum multiglobuliferum TaxID=64969 RepID=A0A1T4S9J6_9GAMM|nr:8-amino-7-oxononanoate synthase [Oceanospirillum multiglobuliferum]OPX54352.1 8-amino-7-oxononanoate synthase [Oceanospirillum multiglobuliferum]SKA24913.1 8-amino-7-oxononanoate synthase [Oceanospirillum multiglobuliferum]